MQIYASWILLYISDKLLCGYVFYVGDPAELVAEQLIRFNTQIFINI